MDETLEAFFRFVTHHRKRFLLALGALAAFIIICLVLWEQFTWPYLWGPIEADARDEVIDGVGAGYNIVNTIFYGISMAIAVYLIYKMLRLLGVKMDLWNFIALSPFIWMGGSVRALEDSALFGGPFSYLFIAPIIYFVLGLSAIGGLLIGYWFSKQEWKRGFTGLACSGVFLLVAYSVIVTMWGARFALVFAPEGFAFLTFLSLVLASLFTRKAGRVSVNATWFFLGLPFALMSLLLVLRWLLVGQWGPEEVAAYPKELLLISGLAAGASLTVYAGWALAPGERWKTIFGDKMNLLIVFGHFLDASATYRGIDAHGYVEKHVLPEFLINATGTAFVMFPLKLVVIMTVLWLIDIEYKDELKGMDLLKNLLKFAIFVLGVAPGIRDAIRLAMGV